MYGYIYKTTNLVNNKIYIGQHHASIFEPNRYIGSGLLITEAINKYGFDNFKCELLAECESAEELNNLEQFYIKKFNSQNLEIGYNIAAGGKNVIKFGETNGNCRSDLNRCNYAKQLLDSGLSIAAVAKEARLSKSIVSRIRRGMHWSCTKDNYICTCTVKTKVNKRVKMTEAEKKLKKKLNLQKHKQEAEAEFLKNDHFCLYCGSKITKLVGSGLFCSRSCSSAYGASKRDNTNLLAGIANRRSFAGENNPNYGKKASKELREKISNSIKTSDKYINVLNSSRFSGQKHSEDEKLKISNSVKEYYRQKEKKDDN